MSPTPSWLIHCGGEGFEPSSPASAQPSPHSPHHKPTHVSLSVSSGVAPLLPGDSRMPWGQRGRVSPPWSLGCPVPLGMMCLCPYRTMYWSDWGNHPKIETAAMDGTLRETLVQDNIQWPTGERGDRRGQKPRWGHVQHFGEGCSGGLGAPWQKGVGVVGRCCVGQLVRRGLEWAGGSPGAVSLRPGRGLPQ